MKPHPLLNTMLALAVFVTPCRAEEADPEIHEELRAVLKTTEEAVRSGRFNQMLPVLSEGLRITPITQEICASRPEMSAYFARYFGADKKLRSLNMSLEADARTELSADKTWGLVYGKGLENYTLNDGRTFSIPTRWTSTVVKEPDGKWRIRSMHIGTNFLDNPLLTAVEAGAKKFTILGTAAGGLLGLLGGFLLGRRRAKARPSFPSGSGQ